MGQRQSILPNWTMDEWAFGTGENAVQLEEVVQEMKRMPTRYFGGKAIENDASMQQLQTDLLSFDDTLRRIFSRALSFFQKNNKHTDKKEKSSYAYYDEYEHYYDQSQHYYHQNQPAIPEEDEDQLSGVSEDSNKSKTDQKIVSSLPWRCQYCTADNKFTDMECRQCKENPTKL